MGAFTMPSLGADMDEGVLQEWLVRPGDTVRRGEVVAVVETDKSAIEVECFEAGTVGRLLVEEGTRVPVGTPLAVIEDGKGAGTRTVRAGPGAAECEPAGSGERSGPVTPVGSVSPGDPARLVVPVAPVAPVVPVVPVVREPVSSRPAPMRPGAPGSGPLVRHLAAERHVDLTAVRGTGRGGRITRSDVEHMAESAPARVRATPYARRLAGELGVELAPLHGTGQNGAVRAADVRTAAGQSTKPAPSRTARPAVTRTDGMRQAIGALMSRSKREIPHYYLSSTIDLTAATRWLYGHNRDLPPARRLLPAAFLLTAAARAARDVPQLNGYWRDGGFVAGEGVHLGMAVSLRDGGLLVPVIHDADTLTADALMARLKDLVQKARKGRLRGSELSGATLTVTSLGDQGVESVFGVIHPPQVALVGFGAVVERPWAADGLLGVRPVVTATLSADHRASDGATGARYLTAIGQLLQEPEVL
ncbi:dihydrolipoamide acetyltransferase family protein [Streptomyces sp. NPDC050085]|uniref:dihydrolipoamide acetyltransferase family protein n=1 Tax=Streptomyces sp. NPDC050085 TaxID=3365600 RepID=UPI00378B12CA